MIFSSMTWSYPRNDRQVWGDGTLTNSIKPNKTLAMEQSFQVLHKEAWVACIDSFRTLQVNLTILNQKGSNSYNHIPIRWSQGITTSAPWRAVLPVSNHTILQLVQYQHP